MTIKEKIWTLNEEAFIYISRSMLDCVDGSPCQYMYTQRAFDKFKEADWLEELLQSRKKIKEQEDEIEELEAELLDLAIASERS